MGNPKSNRKTRIGTVLSNKMELGYTIAENWWIAASAFVIHHNIHGVTGLEDVRGPQYLSVEAIHPSNVPLGT